MARFLMSESLAVPASIENATPLELIQPSPRMRRQRMPSLYDQEFEHLNTWVAGREERTFRAAQIFDWAYDKLVTSVAEMTNLPPALREALGTELPLGTMTIDLQHCQEKREHDCHVDERRRRPKGRIIIT